MQFSITTLGCKVNQYDGCAVAAALRRAGLQTTDKPTSADLVVINTCCVTTTAMRKSRQTIRRIVRAADNPAVLVIGCYSDYDGQRITKLLAELGVSPRKIAIYGKHNDLHLSLQRFIARIMPAGGPANVKGGSEWLQKEPGEEQSSTNEETTSCDAAWVMASPETIRTRRKVAVKRKLSPDDLGPIDSFPGHQRAFVKVQDGCDAFCSYCIVPFTRPRVSSRPIDHIADECSRLIDAGHKEIVLCGVFLGAFGRETAIRHRANKPSLLPRLLARVASLEGLWRVRLSSLEPADVTDDLLAVYRDTPTIAPHLHLPLQSGSDAILSRMNRQYSAGDFHRTVDRLRTTLDRPAITTDIIVGFPGETDEDFAATMDVARLAGFAKIHAFPFSPIEGTAAYTWRYEGPAKSTVKHRMAELADLERDLAGQYRQPFVGQTVEALVESARPAAPTRQAMTDRYLSVFFAPDGPRNDDLTGRVATFEIDDICEDGLQGRMVDLV
ncbi:MAG: MiaB/RimO family radical SAM methylthiotransferase [Planctomycetota bacterium]|jgi:threonylcarbamoyladenosine tRNA methylthiotransferase MtaB